MRNLESGFPRLQFDFCPPDGADQHETFLRTADAYAATESEQACSAHNRACLFQDFPVKGLFPRLVRLGTASRPSPSQTIAADQHDAPVRGYAKTVRAMGRTVRRCEGRAPGSQPITTVGANCEIFAIASNTVLDHVFSSYDSHW